MELTVFRKQVTSFKNARTNLLIVTILTSINFFLGLVGSDTYFLFSAIAPQMVHSVGSALSESLGISIFAAIGVLVALGIILAYFLFWLLSKRNRGLMVAALVLFSIDTVLFFGLIVVAGFEIGYIMDIVFHVWVLLGLVMGVKAWSKLRGVDVDGVEAALKQAAMEQGQMQQGGDMEPPVYANYTNNQSFNEQAAYEVPVQNEIEN